MSYEIYMEMVDLFNKIEDRSEKASDITALLITIKRQDEDLFKMILLALQKHI